MSDLIREAPVGQILRFITRNKVLQYPEEKTGYELPTQYITALNESREKLPVQQGSPVSSDVALEKINTKTSRQSYGRNSLAAAERGELALSRSKSRSATQNFTEERLEVEEELALERTKTLPIAPTKTSDGTILVDWYTTDDPANPQNWSSAKKGLTAGILCLYTFAGTSLAIVSFNSGMLTVSPVYQASAIVTPAQTGISEVFNVSPTASSLTLSLYVLAYGIGPLLFAPLSEIAIIGRNPVYMITFGIFVILAVPTALVRDFGGLLVLRFLQGFFGSPCLANGGATMGDLYSLINLPYALIFWVSAAYCGPALGPLLSGFAVMEKGWRWSLWEILWVAAPIFIMMMLFMPETSGPNILLRRAARLRKLTGDKRLMAQSEIDSKNLKPAAILTDALIKPLEITLKDPAIAFVNLYTALVYGIYYSFFEVFPIVYIGLYGFNAGTLGVLFTCILVACVLGAIIYWAYLYFYLVPDIMKNGLRAQESRLVPALIASFGPPIGLFIYGWTSRESIHWIVPTIGIVIYGGTVFVLMQCIFVYVPLSYPKYAASLFAGNDFFRSAFACGSVLFGRPLFLNLGVGNGVSVLAGLSFLGVFGIFALYFTGAQLRARSKFAQA